MKIPRDKIGKKIRLWTRYGKIIEGNLESIKNGMLIVKHDRGSDGRFIHRATTTLMEGQVVAIEEIDSKGDDA